MVVITVILFTHGRRAGLDHAGDRDPVLTVATLWFTQRLRARLHRVRDGIAGVLGDLSESLHGVRIGCRLQPPALERRAAPQRRRRLPGGQQLHRADQRALRSRHADARVPRPGRAAGDRRQHGAAPPAQLGALVAFFLYLNRFFAPIQLLVQQYNTFQQGQSSVLKLRTLFAHRTEHPRRSRDAVELPPIIGEIVFDDVTLRLRPGRRPVLSGRRTAHRSPARPSPSSVRPALASRRWPSWSPASTTRPPGRC